MGRRDQGLKSFPPEDRPNPIIPFFAFRIMVGIGMIMIAVGIIGSVLWLTGRLYHQPLVPAHPHLGVAARLRRRAGRLVHHRGRAPALDRLWRVAHRRRGLAGAGRQRAHLAHPLRARLRHRVRRRASITLPSSCSAGPTRRRRSPKKARPICPTGPWRLQATHDRLTSSSPSSCRWSGRAILALAVFLYVLLGGYDLGLGVLFPLAPSAQGPRRHDELGRALLGRQRDLARARRRRACSRPSRSPMPSCCRRSTSPSSSC